MANKFAVLLTVEDGIPSFRVREFYDGGGSKLDYFYKEIKCKCIDIVNPYALKDYEPLKDLCLVVDDEGLLKEEPKVNPIASLLYGVDKHGQGIFGDALVCKNIYTEDGIETGSLTIEEVQLLDFKVQELIKEHNERIKAIRAE